MYIYVLFNINDINILLFPIIQLEEEISSFENIKCENKFILNTSLERDLLLEKVKEVYEFIEGMSKENVCVVIGYFNDHITI